jgi:hypothetical protein
MQGGCEEDDTVASPGDEETHLINDGGYEDREEKCEGDFDGRGSPINDCYGRQGAIRNMPVRNYPTHSILLQGDENDAIVRDRDTDGIVAIRRDVDQSEHDDTDMEEKEKEEIDERIQARESSMDDEEEEEDDDETPTSPLHDIESEVCKNFLLVLIFPILDIDCLCKQKVHPYYIVLMLNHIALKQLVSHHASH